jgi:hypothetical protein
VPEAFAYPGTKPEWRSPQASRVVSDVPVIPISLIKDGQRLSYFSMLTTVATPQTIATQELRIESMFPVDDATEARHSVLMSEAPDFGL